jgi:DNA-binding transcriptional MerR regulator/effector-binding domain-containing protein
MNSELFSVGEFSKVTGLSVKTLRFYHEKGLLLPTRIDESSGYRYYDPSAVERARIIVSLRDMEFSLEEIAQILEQSDDDSDLLNRLELQKVRIAQRMSREREIVRALDRLIASEREARETLQATGFRVEERTLPEVLIAGFRMRGKYSDCGKGFAKLGRAVGRYISGKPFCLYYDAEYKDDDADIETCFPIRKEVSVDGISVRMLPAVRCLTLIHRGPYPQLGRSYERILRAAEERGVEPLLPAREVYLKGPGMIFRGNPKKYLTEIQMPFTA